MRTKVMMFHFNPQLLESHIQGMASKVKLGVPRITLIPLRVCRKVIEIESVQQQQREYKERDIPAANLNHRDKPSPCLAKKQAKIKARTFTHLGH